MKIIQKSLLALAAGSLIVTTSHAAVNFGNDMVANPYIGIKLGQYDLDTAKDKSIVYGVYGGAKFSPNWGIEAEYMKANDEDFSSVSEYNADVLGIYGTFDYLFPTTGGLYAKARLGIAKNEVDVDGINNNNISDSASTTGVAGGLGLGYNMGPNAAIEVAYDIYPQIERSDGLDLDSTALTLAAKLKF